MFSLLVRRDGLIEPPPMDGTDSHCHILPGLDDGAPDDETAIAIAGLLVEMGIHTVVATPHVISDVFPNSTASILDAANRFSALLSERKIPLRLIPGAEYYLEKHLLQRIAKDDIIAWGKERFVLFESPVEREPMLLDEVVFSLKSAGYTPVFAHVERYRYLQNDYERIRELKRLGVRFQVNHPSFHLPKISRRGELARLLYIKGLVDLFGTDFHRATMNNCQQKKRRTGMRRTSSPFSRS